MNKEIKELKIGMYTTDEILEFMTNGEGRGFMGRSMYDAILDYITNLQENKRLTELDENYPIEEQLEEALKYENLYKSKIDKAIEYNYELQERYCHSALFDDLVASKIYEITEKQLKILKESD